MSAKSNTTYNVNDLSSDTLVDGDDPEVSGWRDQVSAASSSNTSMHSPSPNVRLNPLKDKASDSYGHFGRNPSPYFGRGKTRI